MQLGILKIMHSHNKELVGSDNKCSVLRLFTSTFIFCGNITFVVLR